MLETDAPAPEALPLAIRVHYRMWLGSHLMLKRHLLTVK